MDRWDETDYSNNNKPLGTERVHLRVYLIENEEEIKEKGSIQHLEMNVKHFICANSTPIPAV